MVRAACATLAAVALASAAFSLPAAAAVSDKDPGSKRAAESRQQSSLTKTGTNLTTGSTTTATQGDTIQWVVNYSNPDGNLQPATITDVIQGGPGSTPQTQTYVPGSLDVPPGFTGGWSTDGGTTFVGTDQGTATNALQATNPAVGAPATSTSALIPGPLTAIQSTTGGDGYTPILFTATINGVSTPEVWNIYHHAAPGTPAVVCTSVLTGGPCPTPTGAAQTWPQPLNSSVAGTLTGDLGTPTQHSYVQIGSNLYYPAGTDNPTGSTSGVGCIDLQTQQSCGYTVLETVPGGGGNTLGGVVQAPNGLIYAVSSITGNVLCFDPATNASCGSFPIGLTPGVVPAFSGLSYAGLQVINGKVFIGLENSTQTAFQVSCFDPATNAACTGWETPELAPGRSYTVWTAYDLAGNEIGVCRTNELAPTPIGQVDCWDLAGNPIADPAGLEPLLQSQVNAGAVNHIYGTPFTITAPNGHLITEYSYWFQLASGVDGVDYCYDWTTQSPCAGFGNVATGVATFPNINGGDTRIYGFNYDGQCKYALGDSGVLFTLDPLTGSAPCLRTTANTTINPFDYYCDGQLGHVDSYGTVTLANIDPSTVDYANSSVTIRDSNSNVLGTFPFNPATQSADISSIPVTTAPIQVEIDVALLNDSSFTPNNQPVAQVNFVGDPPQMCFQTVVSDDCAVTSVVDQATATTDGVTATSNTVTLQVTASGVCLPVDLEVDKETTTTLLKAKPDKAKSSSVKKAKPGMAKSTSAK